MNKIALSMFLFLLTVPLVYATPVIQNVSIQPSYVWLGEDASISLICLDSDNNTIERAYASISGPDVTLPTMYFSGYESYDLFVSRDYLDRIGQFDVTVYCESNNSETTSYSTSFTVSKLMGYINGIVSNPAYTGETTEIDFIVKKNNAVITSDVVFNVSLNDQLKNLKVIPAYDSIKGWMLKIDTPSSPGIYNVKVVAFYDRTNLVNYSSVEVRNSVEFNIESIDKGWVKSNDNITVTLRALEKGSPIDLNENNINIRINSVDAEITTISKHDNLFDVKIIAPVLSSGRYNIEAYLSNKGYSYSSVKPIDYIVSIAGTIVDANNVAMSVQMKFIQNGATKLSLSTDSYGHYGGSLPPDRYDVEISFPKSRLYLYDTSITSFDDPIKYLYFDDADVPGIRNAGLYDYEIDLPYSSTKVEVTYNEKNVINENDLKVFKCSSWNSGRKICNGDWFEISGEIDTVRNRARINSSTFSAFLVGELKSINVDFSLDKNVYNLDDKISIRGITKDEDRGSVSSAVIEAYVKNTGISSKVTSDSNGVFSMELPVPRGEGNYELVLKAKKYPYREFNGVKNFGMVKSKSILIEFPDTVKIPLGENLTQEVALTNNGQADVNDMKVYLEGVPESYYAFSENVNLKTGEKKSLYLKFFIPFYAQAGVSSATIKAEGNNVSQEKIFGLNIFEKDKNVTVTTPTTGLASGFSIPEISYLEIAYIVLFAAVCFFAAIILKKIRIARNNRDKIKNFLFDVKVFVKKKDSEVSTNEEYDKVILTEFPNFLKFSKKLTKRGLGDEDG